MNDNTRTARGRHCGVTAVSLHMAAQAFGLLNERSNVSYVTGPKGNEHTGAMLARDHAQKHVTPALLRVIDATAGA